MTCPCKNIEKIQGDTYKRSFIFKDKDGVAINLTGSVIKFSMKVKPTDVAFVVNQTLTLTDAVNGKASLSVNMTMDVGKYYYDIEWTDSGGTKRTLEIGTVAITQGIT